MAENTVVKDQLTDAMIEAGAVVTRMLDEKGGDVTAALWLFDPEINEWRLLFSSPEIPTSGPRKFYGKIHTCLNELGAKASAIPFSTIRLVDPNSDLVQLLKLTITTGKQIARIRFSKNVINGHYIDDALIYRIC